MAPFYDAGPAVVDYGLVAHSDAGGNIGGEAVAETVGVARHLFFGKHRSPPGVVSADDAVVREGRVNLVRVAVRSVVQGFIICPHSTGKQAGITHFVMRRLENRLAVGSLVRDERIVRVHTDFFQQGRSPKVGDNEERNFLDSSVHDEFEHTLQGYPAAAYGLEDRGEGGGRGVEFLQKAGGEGANIVQALETPVRRIDCRQLVPEQLLFAKQRCDIFGVA